ncbi:MAG: threonine synthase, partial [Actinomycetota bacterium]|nr:threonine synthase [Actinomycetota bacterium]
IFTETAGGVTISTLERLVRSGAIDREQETVALITGVGLKTIEALDNPGPDATIEASVEQVEHVLGLSP